MSRFEKWNGAGNEFIIIEDDGTVTDPASFAIEQCDKDEGIGADGVLLLALDTRKHPPRVSMRLFQPDGSTAAMCGNGARCAAKWASERTGDDVVIVDTPAGERRATIENDSVSIEMGRFSFEPSDIPADASSPIIDQRVGDLIITAVNTGVPHAVSFVPDIDAIRLEEVAPPIRSAALFPDGTNVSIAEERAGEYFQRTFERGVEGETVACGTGAVAIAAVAYKNGAVGVGEKVVVRPPGGELQVVIHEDETAVLIGPVTKEFSGDLSSSDA